MTRPNSGSDPIDWQHWRLRTWIKDWQAAALSVGLNPEVMDHPPQAWMAGTGKPHFRPHSFADAREERQFDKAYALVLDWVKVHSDRVRHYNTNEVELRGFAAWCVENQVSNLPPEFTSIGREATWGTNKDASAQRQTSDGPEAEGEQEATRAEPRPSHSLSVSKNRIIGNFAVKKDAGENVKFWMKLSDPPEWLKRARTFPGGKSVPSLWDPVLVAHCLLDHGDMQLSQLDKVIRQGFKDRWEQWRDETDADR